MKRRKIKIKNIIIKTAKIIIGNPQIGKNSIVLKHLASWSCYDERLRQSNRRLE